MTTRRQSLIRATVLATVVFAGSPVAEAAKALPQSVAELWADFDPRRDPLEVEVVREWKEDGGVFRLVRYFIGTYKGKPARMAAIYGFPAETQEKLPAVMHIHGGGQRASLSEVKSLVGRGYAALSVNWGGDGDGQPPFNSPDGAQPGDPNTDWGAVDPTQLNVAGYHSMLPGSKQPFEDREHPKNNNWYLLTVGCRRGLTFLEQQPEVDPQRLGVQGYSMGGNLTMYVAGTDDRVKAAVPAVGGQGWRWQARDYLGGKAQQEHIKGDVDLFRRTLSFESYAPLIKCPVLHRSATNDFHGWMDDVYRTNALIANQRVAYAWTPHMNHRLSPEVAVAMPLWFDHYLKGGPALPATPRTQLVLDTPDHIPQLTLTPDAQTLLPVARVEIYYSVDPDPRARFWRSAEVAQAGRTFSAKLPLHTLDLPLFAFANVHHTLPRAESLPHMSGITEVCLSSLLHHTTAAELQAAGARGGDAPAVLIDDFAHGWRDWYRLNPDNKSHWQYWTRKVTDPKWRGPDGASLKVTLTLPETNRMTFVLMENEWRGYRGPKKTFLCEREIEGRAEAQSLSLSVADFKDANGGSPGNWQQLDQLGICANYERREPKPWRGEMPKFHRIEWKSAPAR